MALYALTFVVALPPGVCLCDLEGDGSSCCGPGPDLSAAAEPEACCEGCAQAPAKATAHASEAPAPVAAVRPAPRAPVVPNDGLPTTIEP